MARIPLAAVVAVVLAVCSTSAAKPHALANCDEFSRVVTYAHSLEENPLAKDNLQMRMWLTEWIVNSPSVEIAPYKELDSLDAVNNTYSQQLRMQAMYSQVAFQLEHPKVKDPTAIQAAGLAGTLRAYRAIQRFDPSAKYPMLDDLMSLERKGKLQKYLEHRNKCFDD
jgi:hypothetical protein